MTLCIGCAELLRVVRAERRDKALNTEFHAEHQAFGGARHLEALNQPAVGSKFRWVSELGSRRMPLQIRVAWTFTCANRISSPAIFLIVFDKLVSPHAAAIRPFSFL